MKGPFKLHTVKNIKSEREQVESVIGDVYADVIARYHILKDKQVDSVNGWLTWKIRRILIEHIYIICRELIKLQIIYIYVPLEFSLF